MTGDRALHNKMREPEHDFSALYCPDRCSWCIVAPVLSSRRPDASSLNVSSKVKLCSAAGASRLQSDAWRCRRFCSGVEETQVL